MIPDEARPVRRLLHNASIAPAGGALLPGITVITQEVHGVAKTAPSDGIYTDGKNRFKIGKGRVIPEGYKFVPANGEEDEDTPTHASGAANPDAENGYADHPKWYQEYAAKAEADGMTPEPREENETKTAFLERIGTASTGGTETTAANDTNVETT